MNMRDMAPWGRARGSGRGEDSGGDLLIYGNDAEDLRIYRLWR